MKDFTQRIDTAMMQLQAEIERQRVPLLVMGYVYGILGSGLFYGGAAFAYRALVPAAAPTNA